MTYDIIIPIALKDAFFIHRTIDYIRLNLKDADKIYIITNKRNFSKLNKITKKYSDVILLDENTLLTGVTFSKVNKSLKPYGAERITGWYFQQFLKIGFAYTSYAKKYYLSWDADTIPLSHLSFEENGKLYFDCKKEYHEPYFVPIKKLLGLDKVIEESFISEHMLFETEIVKEMIEDIQNNTEAIGNTWWEKIICACDYSNSLNSFSEFETYGTYAYSKYPMRYKIRQLATFRKGGMINGRFISDKMLKQLSFDLDTISFELRDSPVFPLNVGVIAYRVWLKLYSKFMSLYEK